MPKYLHTQRAQQPRQLWGEIRPDIDGGHDRSPPICYIRKMAFGRRIGLVGLGRSKMKRQLITIYDMSFSLSQ